MLCRMIPIVPTYWLSSRYLPFCNWIRSSCILYFQILHIEAKINMWKTAAQDAKDPVRVAYCQGRVTELHKRITLVSTTLNLRNLLEIFNVGINNKSMRFKLIFNLTSWNVSWTYSAYANGIIIVCNFN